MLNDSALLRILTAAFLMSPGAAMAGFFALGLSRYFVSLSGWTESLLVFLSVVLATEALFFWRFWQEILICDSGSDVVATHESQQASGTKKASADPRYWLHRTARHSFLVGFPAMIFGLLTAMGTRAVLPISEEQSFLAVGLPGALFYGVVLFQASDLTPAGALKMRWRRNP